MESKSETEGESSAPESAESPHSATESPYGLPLPPRKIQVLSEEDIDGRDLFIVGDVHGCYDELKEMLDSNHIDKQNTCVVFVGDLVNKGPKSREVVEYVVENGWFSVRGNHDEISLAEQAKEETLAKFEWTNKLSEQCLDWLKQLPYIIHIPSRHIVVVHAGLLPDTPLDKQLPDVCLHVRSIRKNGVGWEWIRKFDDTDYKLWGEMWSGPEHVYFGHDARRFFQQHKFATGLDTACVYGVEMTGIYPLGRQVIKMKSKQVCEKKELYEKEFEKVNGNGNGNNGNGTE